MPDNKKKRKSLVDSVTYTYMRKVKKWIIMTPAWRTASLAALAWSSGTWWVEKIEG